MIAVNLLGIKLIPANRVNVLEQIKKYIRNPRGSLNIISLNPENLVIAHENSEFKQVIETSQIQITDGVGVVLAGKLLGLKLERFTGVDLMSELIKLADELSLRVLLIGGRSNLALQIAKCYSQTYPQAKFKGISGIKNIKNPVKSEEDEIFSIVTAFKPHFIFAAFGSPDQELWLDRHKSKFTGIVCMGVGGGFDFAGGIIPRAPKIFRSVGLEWLFRLIIEPWRWRRQLRLVKFFRLIIQQRLNI